MSTPITWQNIAAPSYEQSSRGLALAQQGINSGFEAFNNVIKQQTDADSANWEQVKKNNTDAFMNKLLEARGAEGFKSLRDSGELDRMIAANGAQIDQAAARAAMDTRLGTLQQRDVQDITYKNTMLTDAQAADVRRIDMLRITNPAAAQAELDARPDLLEAVKLAQNIDTQKQTLVERERSAAEEAQRQLKRPLEIDKLRDDLMNGPIERAYKNSQIGLNQANARRADAEAGDKAAAREAETNKKVVAAALAGNRYADGELKSGDAVGLVEMMNKYKIGDDGTKWWNDTAEKRQKIIERLDTLAKNGHEVTIKDPNDPTKTVKVKVPYAKRDVQDALLGATDKTLSWNEGWADSMEDILKKKYAEANGVTAGSGAPSNGSGRFPSKPGAAADSVIAREYQDYLGALNMGITASGGGKPKKK